MKYRIAGIDVHKRMLAVVIADIAGDGSSSLSGGRWEPVQVNCAGWRIGWPLNKSRKQSWNRRRNIGGQYGRRWSSAGGPNGCRKAPEPGRANCIWRRRSRIEG